MVKHENFKRCDQSGFCKRNRAYADEVTAKGSSWVSPYRIDSSSLAFKDGQLTGVIFKSLEGSEEKIRLPLSVGFLDSGSVRVTVDEERRQKGNIQLRHDSKIRKERYNEATNWALVGGLDPDKSVTSNTEEGVTTVRYGPSKSYEAVIRHAPFSVDFKRDDEIQVRLNGQGFMNMEHWRPKVEKETTEVKEGEESPSSSPVVDESTWWEESFGGNTDSKPRGPESIGLDITFPGYEHVFGIPSHATPLSLKETRYVSLYTST